MANVRNGHKIKLTIWITLAVLISFFLGVVSPIELVNKPNKQMKQFEEIYNLLSDNWYFADDKEMLDRAVDALISDDIDMFTYLNDESKNNNLKVGIGVYVSDYGGYLYVTRVVPSSPADVAGIQEGDIIVSANLGEGTIDFGNLTNDEVMNKLVFSYKKAVTLGIKRGTELLEKAVVPDIYDDDITVTYDASNDKYFKVKISEFDTFTVTDFKNAFSHYNNAKTLIIDLRDNPGGYVNVVEEIADLFLPKGTRVMGFKYRDGKVEYDKANNGVTYKFDNIYIMINKNSASGAEALTACFKENAEVMGSNVYVVGQKSYGKGSAQKDYQLSNGKSIHMTFALWMSPKGNNINKAGINPTTGYELAREDYEGSYAKYKGELKLDDQSNAVLALQKSLKILGKDVYLSGYFDKVTEDALKEIQTDKGIEVTGKLDLNTFNLIRRDVFDAKNLADETELNQVKTWIGA